MTHSGQRQAWDAIISSPAVKNPAIDEQGKCATPDAENDVCRFYPIVKARALMIPAQRDFLDRLEAALRTHECSRRNVP